MGFDIKDVVIATECIEDVDLTHLSRPITCTNIWLLGLLHYPDLAASWRLSGRDLDGFADTVNSGEFTFATI
jgi:hypothetical protein